jgi:hypothetical protein
MDAASRFMSLFAGLDRAYGTYRVNATKGDKQIGEAFTKHEPVTTELWRQHLEGVQGVGIVPIRDDASCVFGAIDVDSYRDFDPAKLADRVEFFRLPLVVCRSKSGGAHVYCFAAAPVEARQMRERLQEIAAILGHGDCEIFPKQAKLHDRGDTGSWINMPYFGGLRGMRYAVKPNGDAYELEEFLAFAESRKSGAKFFAEAVTRGQGSDWIVDGPPCLEQLVSIKLSEGHRNEGMYNIAVYLKKAFGDAWEKKFWEYNAMFCDPPLETEELKGLVKSMGKKDWRYTCSKKPISLYCNSAVCRNRRYGVGGGAGGFVKLGQLRKLLTTPPTWFWDVSRDGSEPATLELTTEQLHSPRLFQIACMNALNHMPVQASGTVWQQLVDAALANVVSMEVPSDSASSEGLFWDLLEKFCTGRAQAQAKDEILLEKPWTDDGYTWFKISALLSFLNRSNFKEYKAPDIAKIFKVANEREPDSVRSTRVVLKGKKTNVWGVREFTRPDSEFEVPESVGKDDKPF